MATNLQQQDEKVQSFIGWKGLELLQFHFL